MLRDIKHKKVFIGVFVMIIICPMIFTFFYEITGKKLDVTLKGNFDVVEKPNLSAVTYYNGTYQAQYESWLNGNIVFRGGYTKLYNQIRYSLFDLGKNMIVGDDNSLYGIGYIEEACLLNDSVNYSLEDRRIEMEGYVEILQSIHEKLAKVGKHLIVYTTPSKAHYDYEKIPWKYRIQTEEMEERIHAIDYMKELIAQTDVAYLDMADTLYDTSCPMFYPTGIHWARPIEQQSSIRLLEKMQEIAQKKYRKILLNDITKSDAPIYRDADMHDLLNVYSPISGITYYEYDMAREFPQDYDKVRILLQGGSFSEGFIYDFLGLYSNEEIHYINYNNYLKDKYGQYHFFGEWNELELKKYLDDVDFVVIEQNESVVNLYSYGFATYLNEYLDIYLETYAMETEHVQCSENLDAINGVGLEYAYGYWQLEQGFVWVKESSSVLLKNQRISEKGLVIEASVPQEIVGADEVIHVYVNQKKVGTISLEQAGDFVYCVQPEQIEKSINDYYEVELISNKSFVSAELGTGSDTRELSLRVYYIGENR